MKNEIAPNELLEGDDGKRLDAAASGEAGAGDQAIEAVDPVNGAAHVRREGAAVKERPARRPHAAAAAPCPGIDVDV